MKECGITTQPTDRAGLFTQGEMFTRDSGLTIRHRVRESTCIKTELLILGSGLMINNMAMVSKSGLMVLNMKAISMKGLRKVMEPLYGLMGANMKDNLRITTLKDLVITFGLMADSTRDLGETIKCTVEVFLSGRMEENMKDSM